MEKTELNTSRGAKLKRKVVVKWLSYSGGLMVCRRDSLEKAFELIKKAEEAPSTKVCFIDFEQSEKEGFIF